MAGSPWSTPPRSPRCLWGFADTYPDSDNDELLSGGGSSDRADSQAADDAFNAAVESQIQNAADAAAADAVAVCFVRGRLAECGIVGPAATFLMATSMADLPAVAVEVLGDDFTELQWLVLHRMRVDAEFGGCREVLAVTRSLFTSDGSPIVAPSPPTTGVPAVAAAAAPLGYMSVMQPVPP